AAVSEWRGRGGEWPGAGRGRHPRGAAPRGTALAGPTLTPDAPGGPRRLRRVAGPVSQGRRGAGDGTYLGGFCALTCGEWLAHPIGERGADLGAGTAKTRLSLGRGAVASRGMVM